MDKSDYKAFRQFLKVQKTLKNYTPKNFHFTTAEEIEDISEVLNLKEMTLEEMQAMRDMVVIYYDTLKGSVPRDDPRWFSYWNGMMSVTAIIDHISHGETA